MRILLMPDRKLLPIVIVLIGAFFLLRLWFRGGVSLAGCEEKTFACAIERMYAADVAPLKDASNPRYSDHLSRQEAAQFFVRLEKSVHPKGSVDETPCVFTDESYIDSIYKSDVQAVCQKGIMRGSQARFFPRALLTTAETIAIIARLQGKGSIELSTGANRFEPYERYASEQNLGYFLETSSLPINDQTPVTLGWLMSIFAQYSKDIIK